MLKKPLEELAPGGVGDDFVCDEDNSADANYLNGVAHAIIPFFIGYFFSLTVGFAYFACVFVLYCSVYRKRAQGFFVSLALIAFFAILMAIPS